MSVVCPDIFHPAQEEQPGDISARVPPQHHAAHLLVRRQVRAGRRE